MKKYLSAQEFAKADEADRQDAVVAKGFQVEAKDDGEDSNTVTFVVSSDSIDRDGDIVYQAGIDWTHFQKNPVILWAHNSRDLPIAKGGNVRKEGNRTLMDMTFAPVEANPKAAQVLNLIKGGFLNTVSIGFIPTEYSWVEDKSTGRFGLDIKRSEALEVSVVPVPSNRDALIAARKAGLDVSPVEDEIRAILKGYELDGERVVAKAPPAPPTPPAPPAPTPNAFEKGWNAVRKALGLDENFDPLPPAQDTKEPALTDDEIVSQTMALRARQARLKASLEA